MGAEGREEVLGRIRRALTLVPGGPIEPVGTTPPSAVRPRQQVVDQFVEYAADYKANVVRCPLSEIAGTVERLLGERGSTRVVVPQGLPAEWLPRDTRPDVDRGFDGRTLDSFHASVTGCAVAVAETGSIVLDGGPGQGRRAITLVPDHHICIVEEHRIVDSIPEAVSALADSVRQGRPLTWISGPSATSDIELTRVEGVHGARKLDILIVVKVP